jgi:hypothetical protein
MPAEGVVDLPTERRPPTGTARRRGHCTSRAVPPGACLTTAVDASAQPGELRPAKPLRTRPSQDGCLISSRSSVRTPGTESAISSIWLRRWNHREPAVVVQSRGVQDSPSLPWPSSPNGAPAAIPAGAPPCNPTRASLRLHRPPKRVRPLRLEPGPVRRSFGYDFDTYPTGVGAFGRSHADDFTPRILDSSLPC